MGNSNAITLDAIIQRNETKFLFNKLGEEMVMMNMENGDFVSMNKVGADIWSLSAQPIPVKQLIQKLLGQYDITEDQCTNEAVHFLQTAMEQNMFVVHNANNG